MVGKGNNYNKLKCIQMGIVSFIFFSKFEKKNTNSNAYSYEILTVSFRAVIMKMYWCDMKFYSICQTFKSQFKQSN